MAGAHIEAATRTAAHARVQHQLGRGQARGEMPKLEPPLLVESDYGKAIRAAVDIRGVLAPLLAALPDLLAAVERERADGVDFELDVALRIDVSAATQRAQKLFDDARKQVELSTSPTRLNRIAAAAAAGTSRAQREDLRKQAVAAIGVDVVTHDRSVPALVAHFSHQNSVLIKSLGRRGIADVEKMTANAFTSGTRHEQLADDIQKRFGISDRHAALIARDQVGKLRGQISAARNTELGIRKFKWRTMGDPDVRPEHEALDGKEFDYETGAPGEGLPGEPVACRCMDEPVFEDVLALLNGEEPPGGNEPDADAGDAEPPSGFDVSADVENDGIQLFSREPDVYKGVPSYAQTKAAPYRESVFVIRPSDLASDRLYGIDTGGSAQTDSRTASITKAWQHGKELPPIEVHVSPQGDYFVADGNHRLWAAAHAGNRPVAVQFRPILVNFTRTADKIGDDLAKLVKPTKNPSTVKVKAPKKKATPPLRTIRKTKLKGEGAVSEEAANALVSMFMK